MTYEQWHARQIETGGTITPETAWEAAELILRGKVVSYRNALVAIANNPTGDSTGLIEHRNQWTEWAKKRAEEALKYDP